MYTFIFLAFSKLYHKSYRKIRLILYQVCIFMMCIYEYVTF